MTIDINQNNAQFEQSKNPLAEIREALPASPKPELFSFPINVHNQGNEMGKPSDSQSSSEKRKTYNLIKLGLRIFSWVFVLGSIPYYGYSFWTGEYFLPNNGEEELAGWLIFISFILMLIGSQQRNTKRPVNHSLDRTD